MGKIRSQINCPAGGGPGQAHHDIKTGQSMLADPEALAKLASDPVAYYGVAGGLSANRKPQAGAPLAVGTKAGVQGAGTGPSTLAKYRAKLRRLEQAGITGKTQPLRGHAMQLGW